MINVAKKYIKPTTEQEIEQLRKDIVQELAHWKICKYGCQDPFWPDGTNMNLVRNHIIYAKERLKEQNLEIEDEEVFEDNTIVLTVNLE